MQKIKVVIQKKKREVQKKKIPLYRSGKKHIFALLLIY
jgi:hypothetical protein